MMEQHSSYALLKTMQLRGAKPKELYNGIQKLNFINSKIHITFQGLHKLMSKVTQIPPKHETIT